MAVKKTKKLSAQPTTTTVATGEKFAKVDANGKVTLIDLANLKTALLGGLDLNGMTDGVFIMYHLRAYDEPILIRPHKWPALQAEGEKADGVAVVEGGKILVVAPTEASDLTFSSAQINGGATTSTDYLTVTNDWNGKANTASIISKSTAAAVTNTAAYAPGFCNLYSRSNAAGHGLTAGKWWLPSVAEMLMIYANMAKINYCLSLITGAMQLSESWYVTSTERDVENTWCVHLDNGLLDSWLIKASDGGKVRPVSAFIR